MASSKNLKQNGANKRTTDVSDEHVVFHTRHVWTAMHSSGMKLPWELTLPMLNKDALEPFHKRTKLLGNTGPCCMSPQADPGDLFDQKRSSYADAGLRLMRKTDENFWQQQISFDRKAAYKKWTSLIMEEPGSWVISRPRKGDGLFELLQHGLVESIRDALGVKATSTLHGRANPLLRYVQFAKKNDVPPFPMKESIAYAFLKETDTAPTFPRSFITSVAFAKHVLGLLHADEVLDSSRIKGHAAIHFAKKRKLVQRPALTVDQIKSLENCVKDEGRTMYDRIASGFFLLLVYGRLRFSDGQSITSMELEIPTGADRGYLECAAERCKTSTSLEKRTRLLPVVVPTLSFTEEGWIEQWIRCREQQGLVPGSGKPMLPTPAAGGGWTKIPVSCEVAGDWLRASLKDVPAKTTAVRIATHSCKSAVLSMCAKYGMEPSARRLLGYHSAGKDKSMLTYSRDAMSWPIRLMEEMIQQINADNFVPDASRSGYFPAGNPTSYDGKDVESTSSSCDSMDEEVFSHSADEQAVEEVAGTWGGDMSSEDALFFRHKISRCLHKTADETGLLFRCGRMVSGQYDQCEGVPKFLYPSCTACFRNR